MHLHRCSELNKIQVRIFSVQALLALLDKHLSLQLLDLVRLMQQVYLVNHNNKHLSKTLHLVNQPRQAALDFLEILQVQA